MSAIPESKFQSPKTWYAFVRWIVRTFFFKGTGGLAVRGLENVPPEGPLIVAPNHVSHLDPPVTACAINRQITFMAKAELFDHGLFGKLIASLGAFPVRRGEGDTEAIRLTLKLLEEGRAVLMFPEGTRGDGTALLPFNKGVAMIARRSGAPVLPVGISGTHRKWPRGRGRPRWGKVTVVFGEPLKYDAVSTAGKEVDHRDAFAHELARRIRTACEDGGYSLKESLPA